MRLFTNWKIRNVVMVIMLTGVVMLSVLSSLINYLLNRNEELKTVDEKLYAAAVFAEQMLPEGHHDRITGPDSVSLEEYNHIVDRFNRICKELDLEYLWSLMLVDGQPVFTSSTSPDKQVANRRQAEFFELHSNPELYEKAFRTMQPQYQNNRDKWGVIRAVLLPRLDSNGRKYLIGASMKQSEVENLMPTLLHEALAGIMQTCKTLTREISPTTLYETDIGAGLKHMAADLQSYFGLSIRVHAPDERIEVSHDKASLIFRGAKELLVNAAKHSDTRKAEICISRAAGEVQLVVTDQGKGFDPQLNGDDSSGFGLFSIRERIQHIQGSMAIESAPEQGSRITITFPSTFGA